MDNRVLDINGYGQSLLTLALNIAIQQRGVVSSGFRCFKYEPEYGLILDSYYDPSKGFTPFLAPADAPDVAALVMKWLTTAEADAVHLTGQWEGDCDHDGDNSKGWRVYVDDWGRVGAHSSPICAVKPTYLWHGK